MKKPLKIILYSVGALLGLMLILILTLFILSPGKTTPVTDDDGNEILGSISEMEEIVLGGIKQWIITRGHSTENPVLLYVHGGPGSTEFPFYRKYITELEKDFTVVHWEQRGAGKSYSEDLIESDLEIDKYVSDINELSTYLKEKYSKDKIYLLGHSWGTTIGVLAVQQHPEHFYAYIGMGQEVNLYDGLLIGNEMLLECAEENNFEKMYTELEQLPNPPYTYETEEKRMDWIIECKGDIYAESQNMLTELFWALLPLKEYTLSDKLNWFIGSEFSINIAEPQAVEIDLREQAKELDVPVYFLQGKYDMQCPTSLVEEYFDILDAPKKELIIFNESAHSPIFEESEKAIEIIKQIATENN